MKKNKFLIIISIIFYSLSSFGIWGGEIIKRGSYPFAGRMNFDKAGDYWCSASAIGPNTVITAAHCCAKSDDPSGYYLTTTNPNGTLYPTEHKLIPENFELTPVKLNYVLVDLISSALSSDVCLIKVYDDKKIDKSYLIPVFLESKKINLGEELLFFGLGESELGKRQMAKLKLYAQSNQGYNTANSSAMSGSGDSGGPLVYIIDNKMYQIGIGSTGGGQCDKDPTIGNIGKIVDFKNEPKFAFDRCGRESEVGVGEHYQPPRTSGFVSLSDPVVKKLFDKYLKMFPTAEICGLNIDCN